MPRVDEIFDVVNAKSHAFDDYAAGATAFLTNTTRDNGVLGFVTPFPGDRVFDKPGIVISTFCDAAVHLPPFLPRGNGGSGLLVLKPKSETKMSIAQLATYSAYINQTLRWRFSWYRQATEPRLSKCVLPVVTHFADSFSARDYLPALAKPRPRDSLPKTNFKQVELGEIFNPAPGEYHEADRLPVGDIPLVSCGEIDNGIIAFVGIPPENTHQNALTVAFNGRPLTTRFHPYRFAAKDDVAVCTPKSKMPPDTLFFIACRLNSECWRYSYYRKCFQEKLARFPIALPMKHGELDHHYIAALCETSSYWLWLRRRFDIRSVEQRRLRASAIAPLEKI